MRATLVRALVLDAYARIRDEGRLADRVLSGVLREHRELHSVERRHVAEAVYAMLRLERRLDFLLDAALAARSLPPLASRATPERHRLRYAAALATELEHTAEAAATAAGAPAPLVPVFERVRSGEARWPEDPQLALAVRASVPDWFAARLQEEYGDQALALAEALNRRGPLTVRANLLKTDRDALARRLREEHVEARFGRWSPWALHLDTRLNAFALQSFREGLFEVQDEGSQLIALAAAPQPGQRVIDYCAGAGGKTLALAATMENRGRVFACDVHADRLEELRPRARRAKAFNVEAKLLGEDGRAQGIAPADVVLVDAPCSGTGAWRRNPDARWRFTGSEPEEFAARQREILARAARLVRPGGRLVYATCSVLRVENEQVVEAFLSERPEFSEEPAPVPEGTRDPRGRLKVLPHVHETDGFFAAVLRRS